MVAFTTLTGERNPIISEYYGNLKRWEKFSETHGVLNGHFKKTCPNPHSGEKYHSQRIWGIILHLESKHALFCTEDEYDLMLKVSTESIEIEFDKLIEMNPFHELRGRIMGKKYGI